MLKSGEVTSQVRKVVRQGLGTGMVWIIQPEALHWTDLTRLFSGSWKGVWQRAESNNRGTLLKCISYPVLCNKCPLNLGAFSQISVSRVWAWLCWLLCFRLSHRLQSCCWSSSHLPGEGSALGLLTWLWAGFIFLQAYRIEGLGALLAAVWRWCRVLVIWGAPQGSSSPDSLLPQSEQMRRSRERANKVEITVCFLLVTTLMKYNLYAILFTHSICTI